MYRLSIFLLGLAFMSHTAAAQQAGVGAWETSNSNMLEWIEEQPGLGWYYNWRMDQIYSRRSQRRSVEFVPMIHGAKNINDRIQSSRRVRTLLGFNEPDGSGGSHQAEMTVSQAIALWPKLEGRGLRLGSPATTQDGTIGSGTWQRRFMTEVERRGLRVDFMAVHYYSKTGNVAAFRKWLIAVHKEYKRPIWVTEFAFIDWGQPGRASYEANAAFAQAAIRMMGELPFVERHAWFAANPYSWHGRTPSINLVDDQLRETPVGVAFQQALASTMSRQVAQLERMDTSDGPRLANLSSAQQRIPELR